MGAARSARLEVVSGILPSRLQHHVAAARVLVEEGGDVVHLAVRRGSGSWARAAAGRLAGAPSRRLRLQTTRAREAHADLQLRGAHAFPWMTSHRSLASMCFSTSACARACSQRQRGRSGLARWLWDGSAAPPAAGEPDRGRPIVQRPRRRRASVMLFFALPPAAAASGAGAAIRVLCVGPARRGDRPRSANVPAASPPALTSSRGARLGGSARGQLAAISLAASWGSANVSADTPLAAPSPLPCEAAAVSACPCGAAVVPPWRSCCGRARCRACGAWRPPPSPGARRRRRTHRCRCRCCRRLPVGTRSLAHRASRCAPPLANSPQALPANCHPRDRAAIRAAPQAVCSARGAAGAAQLGVAARWCAPPRRRPAPPPLASCCDARSPARPPPTGWPSARAE